jgi:sugar phosphate isomerase/epimerase
LGSTSYVYPGDLIHNAERLAGQVGDMELVLFDLPDEQNNLPDRATVERLAQLGQAYRLTYTVHLPHDLRDDTDDPTSDIAADPKRQPPRPRGTVWMAKWMTVLMGDLAPYAYVFHLEGTGAGSPDWTRQAIRALEMIASFVEDPGLLALENLESYPPEYLEPIFAAVPIRRTLDIGHLWKQGRDPLPLMDAWLPQTSVVHLHGMADTDHRSLALMAPAQLDPVVKRLAYWSGVLTLEVFEDDFFTSRAALAESWARVTG